MTFEQIIAEADHKYNTYLHYAKYLDGMDCTVKWIMSTNIFMRLNDYLPYVKKELSPSGRLEFMGIEVDLDREHMDNLRLIIEIE
jgi:hypothetical protein